jgi:hypothetical protein
VDVAWLLAFATEKEKAIAADAKNFWHAREFYSHDIGTDKDFGDFRPPLQIAADTTAATEDETRESFR